MTEKPDKPTVEVDLVEAGRKGHPAAEPTTNTRPQPGEKVLEWVRRTIDPSARQLWDVQGPRDGNSRLTCLLVRIGGDRREIIAQRFEPDLTGETFILFGEIAPAELVNEANG